MSELEKFNFNGVDKFLVTGFHETDNVCMSSLLDTNGIKLAKPSKNEKMDATEISEVILKTQKKSIALQNSNISPVWNSLALDLFLGNVDQEFWCWHDAKALKLLDFWKNLDSQIAFILVYNSPQQIISDILNNKTLESVDEIDLILQKWVEYNQNLLNFYYRNKEKSLLIHAGQINKNQEYYLEILQKKVGIELKSFNKKTVNQFEIDKVLEIESRETSTVQDFLISQIVSENLETQKIYDELQSVANIFYNNHNFSNAKNALSDFLLTKQNYEKEYDNLMLEKENLDDTQKKLKKIISKKNNKIKKFAKIENITKEQKEENELLLQQLHSVQEELEKYYIAKTELTKEIEQTKADLEDKQKKLQDEISKKNSEIEKFAKIKNLTKEQEQENELLLQQLHTVQEELEKYYLENKRLKEKEIEKKRYYGAAERVKQQLSYRLGAKMIEESKSFFGILGLPFSLLSVKNEYKKDMKERKGKKLPPIESYADAYDAQRVKKHLSYMLGQTMIKTMKNPFGIFILPFKLSTTYKTFKKNKSK